MSPDTIYHCTVCGGELEPSGFGGSTHVRDSDDDHTPQGGE